MPKPFPKGHDFADVGRQGGPSLIIKHVPDNVADGIKDGPFLLRPMPIFPPPTSVFSQKGFMAGRPEILAADRKELKGELMVVHSFGLG